MANPQQQENMLLTEHFSWPPISLIDDIINTINEVLYRCTDTFATGITSAPPHLLGFADRYAAESRTPATDENGDAVFPDAALEIEEGVLKLETLMENAVDKNFDKLEIWTLRNVLCLPRGEEELASWVRLGHYAGVETATRKMGEGGDGESKQWTPEALYALRRKLIETQKLNAALLGEQKRNDALLKQLRGLLNPRLPTAGEVKNESLETTTTTTQPGEQGAAFAFLTHTPASQSLGVLPITASATATATPTTTPLATHSSFATSQLPHLRHLLSTLRPHLSSTALPSAHTTTHTSSSSDPEGAEHDASRERKLYLESQSRRILERRGVDTKEGVEGVVEGGRVRGEEVRGLEGLIGGAFGRGRIAKVEDEGGKEDGEEMDLS